MKVNVTVPAAGESISEADIVTWHKSTGDHVSVDDPLVDLETDKANLTVSAEVAGELEILKTEGTVKVGDIIATIDDSKVATASTEAPPTPKDVSPEEPTSPQPEVPTEDIAKEAPSTSKKHPSIAASKIMSEKGLSLDEISGTGKDGRITKQDVVSQSSDETKPSMPAPTKESLPEPKESATPSSDARASETREKMSRIRQTIANRMVQAQQTAALLTTFNEVDMSAIMELRQKYKESFLKKYDVKLGFMSFFSKAVCNALEKFPIMNSRIEENEIITPHQFDIGIAVATPKGLIVPVLRDVKNMSFSDIEQGILDYALKARDGKISPSDLSGGTFTITNGGTFGSMLSTPIVNAPQSAILGMHNIVKRAVVVNDNIEIRPMMYLAVTYDHRLIDGAQAVQFLVTIKEGLEDPSRLLLAL